jgi:DNA-binding transcriptional LysR family regulator
MPLPLPRPDLASIDLLVTVSEGHSISEAAAVHGLTQPAASMRLRTLERVLGLQLVERSRSGSRLTPAGAATVQWASRILEDTRALLAGAAALRNDERTHLRLAASLTVAEYLIPGWLQALSAVLPDVGVSLRMGNTTFVAEAVEAGDVDLGFVEGHRRPRRLKSRDLRDDDLVIVVGRSHPWARRRRPLSPEELAATPLILREPGSGTREVLVEALGELGLAVTVLLELGSTTAIKSAVTTGRAPAVLSALAVEAELSSRQLVAVGCDGIRLHRTIRAIWSERRPLGESAARLLVLAGGRVRATG